MQGHVVGMNTMSKRDADSVHFAVPVDLVREEVEHILLHGRARRNASLGACFYRNLPPLLSGIAKENNVIVNGIVVRRTTDDGPASVEGLRELDIVTHIDGFSCNELEEMH